MNRKSLLALFLVLSMFLVMTAALPVLAVDVVDTVPGDDAVEVQTDGTAIYAPKEDALIAQYRTMYTGSLADKIVGRGLWYMVYGFTKYGHTQYATTGYIDCSQFTSRVYKDFGYSITGVSRYYNTVGKSVPGVYSQLQPGSTTKWMLVGTENLKPGDILTFWKDSPTLGRHIGHVALYVGVINGKPTVVMTVSGRPTALGMTDSFTYWYGEHFQEARRVLPDSAYVPESAITGNSPVIPAVYQIAPTYPIIMPKDLAQGF